MYFFDLQNYVESDYETDFEDEPDFSSSSLITPQTIIVNDIEDKDNALSKREYLKLVFSNEDTSKNILIKRASKFWWLNKSEAFLNGGPDSSHFALKR